MMKLFHYSYDFNRFIILYWMLLCNFPFMLQAEMTWQANLQKPFAVNIKLNSQQLFLDDILDVEAEFHYYSSYQLDINALIDQLIGSANPLDPQWSLLQSTLSALPSEAGTQAQRLDLKISPLKTGSVDLSFLMVSFLPTESTRSPLHILTPVFSLKIFSVPPLTEPLSSASLMPLEPQFPLELTQANRQRFIDNPEQLEETKKFIRLYLEEHAFPWLTIAAILGCGGLSWAIYLMRDRWPKPTAKPLAIFSPQQQIQHDLQTLQKSQWIEQGKLQAYYAELGSILLSTLQLCLGWKTKELTTEEVMTALKHSPQLPESQKQIIVAFLAEIDQIKFADKKPAQTEVKQISQQIQTFIQQLLS